LAWLVAMVLAVAGTSLAFNLIPWPKSETASRAIGGPFALTAGNGQRLTDRDFRGKWLLVYFGYTHCPDICPTTLAEISRTIDLLGPAAANVQPLFITIDPARDTYVAVDDFVAAIDGRIIGMSGTPLEIAAVAKAYHVYYAKEATSSADGESYLMEHTAFVYVMGPDGKYATLFSPLQGQSPDDMASRLREMISHVSSE
jgi:protein SCO1/2